MNKKLKNLVLVGLGSVMLMGLQPLVAGTTASDADNTMADSSGQAMTPEQQTFCRSLAPKARKNFKSMTNEQREMCMKKCSQDGMDPSDAVMDMKKTTDNMD